MQTSGQPSRSRKLHCSCNSRSGPQQKILLQKPTTMMDMVAAMTMGTVAVMTLGLTWTVEERSGSSTTMSQPRPIIGTTTTPGKPAGQTRMPEGRSRSRVEVLGSCLRVFL